MMRASPSYLPPPPPLPLLNQPDLLSSPTHLHSISTFRFGLSIPGAIQSLKFAKEVFGENSIDVVPSYLLLAEANLGLKRCGIYG